jgi:hypothetical protein
VLKNTYGIASIVGFSRETDRMMLGPTPGVALFANNARYKREAYRGTPFAPKILASEGIQIAMKVRLASRAVILQHR